MSCQDQVLESIPGRTNLGNELFKLVLILVFCVVPWSYCCSSLKPTYLLNLLLFRASILDSRLSYGLEQNMKIPAYAVSLS